MPCAAAGFGLCGTWWSPATAGSVRALLLAYRRRRRTQTTPTQFRVFSSSTSFRYVDGIPNLLQSSITHHVKRSWFSSEAQASSGVTSGNGIVDVPLAQTGERHC